VTRTSSVSLPTVALQAKQLGSKLKLQRGEDDSDEEEEEEAAGMCTRVVPLCACCVDWQQRCGWDGLGRRQQGCTVTCSRCHVISREVDREGGGRGSRDGSYCWVMQQDLPTQQGQSEGV
jgi:hypothetical protein